MMSSTMWKVEGGKISTLNVAWLWLCLHVYSLWKKRNAYFFILMRKHIFRGGETSQKSSETTQKSSKCLTRKSLKSFFSFTLLQYPFYLNILSVHFTNFQAVIMLPDWQRPAEPGSSGASLCLPQYKTQWHTFYLPQIASKPAAVTRGWLVIAQSQPSDRPFSSDVVMISHMGSK